MITSALFITITAVHTATKCNFQIGMDCDHDDVKSIVRPHSTFSQADCCAACTAEPLCKTSVYIPDWKNASSACLMKSGCSKPQKFSNRVKCCQQGDESCPKPPPIYPCPCTKCPCPPGEVLPRTCDVGSTAAMLPFCDHTAPVANRIHDLLQRLSREEKVNLVTQADTGFLPRLNLKEFHFFNTCVHGWWTSNATTFGMPVGMAASFDKKLMRQIADVIGVESRALSQREYASSYDTITKLHGVSEDFLVCKDSSEVNMNRHPLWGRNSETYGRKLNYCYNTRNSYGRIFWYTLPNAV